MGMVSKVGAVLFSLCILGTCHASQFTVEPFHPEAGERGSANSAFRLRGLASDYGLQHTGASEALPAPRRGSPGAANGEPEAAARTAPPGTPSHSRPHLIELTSANWRPLTPQEKRGLFTHDLLHWETHVSLILDAGFSLGIGDRSYLGGGGPGLGRRYGLNIADEVNFTFFNVYLFPVIFHQDPRYIPRDRGGTKDRLEYALSRTVVTRDDSGRSEINKSKILGIVFATALSSAYYAATGANVSAGGDFASMGINLASDAAFNVLKEFWPDFARKIKMNVWISNLVRAALRDSIRVS